MNASGLLRSMATSIWSSETVPGRFCAAIRPALSPGLTVTCLSVAPEFSAVATRGAVGLTLGSGRAAGAGCAGRASRVAGGVAGEDSLAIVDAGARAGAGVAGRDKIGAVGAPAVAPGREPGGSNSMV